MPKKPPRDKQTRPRLGRPHTAGAVLQRAGTGGTLAAIQASAAGAEALRRRLIAQLPPELASHVPSAIAKPGEVVVFADSAAWAARLKLTLAESPPDLAPQASAADRITVRVMPGGEFRR